jgi:hypothetical protein
VKPEFTEFSYGFALTYEIAHALQPELVAAPLFPSLLEGTGGEAGFPAWGYPIFLQFKLAEYMKTAHAREWPVYGSSYFRLTVPARVRSNRHNLLRALSAEEPDVYYAGPAFYRQLEFNQAFVSNQLLNESRLLPLRQLPDVADDQPHYITYCRGVPGFHWHSSGGRHIRAAIAGDGWLEQLRQDAAEPRSLGSDYFRRLRRRLVELLKEHTLQPDLFLTDLSLEGEEDTATLLRDLRYLLVTYFGVETLILRPGSR